MSRNDDFGGNLLDTFRRHSHCSATMRLRKNQRPYMCGERDNNVYIIESGRIKTITLSRCGKVCMLDIYTRVDVFGESCLLQPERTETATAMTPAILHRIPAGVFLSVLADEGLLPNFLRYLTHRLHEQQQVITHLVTADSEQRLAATLLRLARKLGTPVAGWLRIDQKITQEELSEMVGTTRSRVGYFLKRFRDDELIQATGDSRLVVDEAKLSQYLDARL
jgi:CRP/FNR family transcriptional regulator, cyclic AMP receptor protein